MKMKSEIYWFRVDFAREQLSFNQQAIKKNVMPL